MHSTMNSQHGMCATMLRKPPRIRDLWTVFFLRERERRVGKIGMVRERNESEHQEGQEEEEEEVISTRGDFCACLSCRWRCYTTRIRYRS